AGSGTKNDLGDRVHRVVVARAAEERQPAGHRETPLVVRGDAQAVADVEDRGGEAAVEVHAVQVRGRDPRHVERAGDGQHGGGAARQVGALHQVALAHVGVAVQEHKTVI